MLLLSLPPRALVLKGQTGMGQSGQSQVISITTRYWPGQVWERAKGQAQVLEAEPRMTRGAGALKKQQGKQTNRLFKNRCWGTPSRSALFQTTARSCFGAYSRSCTGARFPTEDSYVCLVRTLTTHGRVRRIVNWPKFCCL